MKKLFFFVTITILCACKQNAPQAINHGIAVTVIYDVTDTRIEVPISESILSYYHFDTDKEQGAYFRIVPITDKVINPSLQVTFLPQSETEKYNTNDDPYFREKQIRSFYTTVKKTITKQLEDTTGYKHSEVFKTIANELTYLIQNPAKNKYLLVYSDLQECSSLANTYQNINEHVLQKLFEKTALLPTDLNDCTVEILFQPRNREEDIRFLKLHSVYEKLLTKKGAIVRLSNSEQYTIL